jgi:hypothetical protein
MAVFLWMATAVVSVAATSPVPTPSVAPATEPSPIFDLDEAHRLLRTLDPYPHVAFHSPEHWTFAGTDIGAFLFANARSGKQVIVSVLPSTVTSAAEEVEQRQCSMAGPKRSVGGYAAINVSCHQEAPMWAWLTKPFPLRAADVPDAPALRWFIMLPDDETILSSFRFEQ